tara:strand:+ start:401 stop:781 length:381 start_codon:yes stop_codon:yes gene_type:complete
VLVRLKRIQDGIALGEPRRSYHYRKYLNRKGRSPSPNGSGSTNKTKPIWFFKKYLNDRKSRLRQENRGKGKLIGLAEKKHRTRTLFIALLVLLIFMRMAWAGTLCMRACFIEMKEKRMKLRGNRRE